MSFFKTANSFLKLQLYNRVHQTNIKSLDVSLKAQLGFPIAIGARSYVDAHCLIGRHVYIGKNCNITRTEIGSYCSIANNVSIGQGEHDLERVSTSSVIHETSYDELTQDACTIGHDVWIGTDAIILRGVHIGNGAVIGANAVVTKDVRDFEVVAGVPARRRSYDLPRILRQRILTSFLVDKASAGNPFDVE